jgi:hypothetical protein
MDESIQVERFYLNGLARSVGKLEIVINDFQIQMACRSVRKLFK